MAEGAAEEGASVKIQPELPETLVECDPAYQVLAGVTVLSLMLI